MSAYDSKLWLAAKVLCYIGAILVTVYAAQVGLLHQEPSSTLFDVAIIIMGVGVAVGVFVSLRSGRRE